MFTGLELISYCTEHVECFTAVGTGLANITCSRVDSFLTILELDGDIFKFLCAREPHEQISVLEELLNSSQH
jgi:hypothetical protein